MASIDRLLFIRSLKSANPSPYLSVRVSDPPTCFVIPIVPSPLVFLSLKSDPVNSIRLPWDLPLSSTKMYVASSLTSSNCYGWLPLGSHVNANNIDLSYRIQI